ncbi:uncharacterized protein LOC127079783 [Lathyrus oleraceus]|uniref:uncharacterized protein LOC127079783 n=1 Tax=Pisum sativum TaxID=3888 RepID=UPI0021D32703|nr:uncharacterized protein LOC127079783 [Pisum sativum]
MSQPCVSIMSKHSKEQSNPKNIGTKIDLSNVITDVVPLSIVPVHATPMRKAKTSSSRKGKPSKVSTSSTPSMIARNMNAPEPPTMLKPLKTVIDLDSDDITIGQRLAPGIAKRLKNRKCQAIGSSNTPSKSVRKRASVSPTKRWNKVVTPVPKKKSLKRKEVPSESSYSDHDVKHNFQDIISTSIKQTHGKKIPANIPEVPFDNISFHSVENVEKWKFIYQRRLALERELGKYAFECKEVTSLIQEARLMKTVIGFGKCYEILVKEFIVNIFKECDNKRSKEFRKVYVRGRCVDFSPKIINRFLGRNEEEQAEIKVSDNVICKVFTVKQVKEWPRKGKLSTSALSVKYV